MSDPADYNVCDEHESVYLKGDYCLECRIAELEAELHERTISSARVILDLRSTIKDFNDYNLKLIDSDAELQATIEEAKNRCNTLINEDARHADNIIWIKEALGDKV